MSRLWVQVAEEQLNLHEYALSHVPIMVDRRVHRPPNGLPDDLAKEYYKCFYARLLAEMKRMPDPRESFILPHFGMRIADIGCGNGDMTFPLLADNNVLGVDIHPHPSSKALEAGLYTLHQDLNTGLPGMQSCSFDVLYCLDIIEHVRDPSALITDMSRILRPGGMCILTTPIYQQTTWQDNYDFHLGMAHRAGLSEEMIQRWMKYEPEINIFGLQALLEQLHKNRLSLMTRAIGYSFEDPSLRIQGPDVDTAPNIALFCVKQYEPLQVTREVARGYWSCWECQGDLPYPLCNTQISAPSETQTPINYVF